MTMKRQGDIGVAMAIAYYVNKGYNVSVPLTDATRYDLIIENGLLKRVQVKSTNQFTANGTARVTLSTQGGNQSWNGIIKRISADEADLVFVYALDGRMWEFPVEFCVGKRNITLGRFQKEYEVNLCTGAGTQGTL